ncbi:hypothetical protein BN129_2506 [Cronobacter sakazakii 701]|nr:hypothetical protein BN129_2506 [Cronobacter sakazakii 701]
MTPFIRRGRRGFQPAQPLRVRAERLADKIAEGEHRARVIAERGGIKRQPLHHGLPLLLQREGERRHAGFLWLFTLSRCVARTAPAR